MKREILFRGKLEYNGKWIYGDLLQYENGEVAIFGDRLSSFGCECTEMLKRDRVTPETIGQYTGLKDKDGKEIYEGDLLEVANRKRDKECIADVIFLDGAFLLHFPNEDLLDIKEVSECWVVIGNIHDNPV
jgi:hypothetical protein